MSDRIARVPVSLELLRAALHIPEDAAIVGVIPGNTCSDTIELLVISDEFDEVPDGGTLPTRIPYLSRRCNREAEIVFDHWGP